MTESCTADHLKARFLEGFAPAERRSILAAAKHRHFVAHSVVQHQGDPADRLFLLTKGRARFFFITQDGQKILLLWLPPGEIFGAMALMSRPSHYLVSAETLKDSCVLAWGRAAIRGLALRYPRLLDNALLTMSEYLTAHLSSHVALTCHTARQRLAQVLVNLAGGIGQEVRGGVELDVSNEELANVANVTPFTASRFLSEWQRNGVVAKSRGKVLLRSAERLLSHKT